MGALTTERIELDAWRSMTGDSQDGASVEFLGMVRREENGQAIEQLEYTAYAPMAERLISRLIEEANRRWPVHQVYARHRLGRVAVGEVAVLIGVRAAHREEAFTACRFLIDAIKRDVPIWKTAMGIGGTANSEMRAATFAARRARSDG